MLSGSRVGILTLLPTTEKTAWVEVIKAAIREMSLILPSKIHVPMVFKIGEEAEQLSLGTDIY